MKYEEMTMEERVDWAAGFILTRLIKGDFRGAVWLVVDQAHRNPFKPHCDSCSCKDRRQSRRPR